MIYFILGGARSGKSNLAQQLAGYLSQKNHPVSQKNHPHSNQQLKQATQRHITCIATACVTDDEMAERIKQHQLNRPAHWSLVESPLLLAEAIEQVSTNGLILVDCRTLWLNNHLFEQPQQNYPLLFDALITSCQRSTSDIILVANEVGLGIVPVGAVNRQFVDEAGRLNQRLASVADNVIISIAGLPSILKGSWPID